MKLTPKIYLVILICILGYSENGICKSKDVEIDNTNSPDFSFSMSRGFNGTGSANMDTIRLCINHSKCPDYDSYEFDLSKHAELSKAGKHCSLAFKNAAYFQDIFHAFESKAHFDNCAFDESVKYVEALLQFSENWSNSNHTISNNYGLIAIGQALHSIQDFYSHSNYIELAEKTYSDFKNVPIIDFWKKERKEAFKQWLDKGLISGYVAWGYPKMCEEGSLTHKELAKDNDKSMRGKLPTRWEGWNYHQAAYRLALEASESFLIYVAENIPELLKDCGDFIDYGISMDPRFKE
jgi:hypothetical protein